MDIEFLHENSNENGGPTYGMWDDIIMLFKKKIIPNALVGVGLDWIPLAHSKV